MFQKRLRKSLLFYVSLCSYFFYAQEQIPDLTTQKGFGQLDYLPVKMPENEVNMDLSGIHYNLKINDWSYVGAGIYGSIGGIRGGFFTLGVNAGIQKKITDRLYIDTGIHFGGGGGASAPDGGGAFILPHFNLGYHFKSFSTTAGYSYINFFDKGLIRSSQFNLALQIPLAFNNSSFDARENSYTYDQLSSTRWNTNSSRNSLLVHFNTMDVTRGNYNGQIIRLAGFEFNSYFNNNIFYFVRADGAYQGIKAGYMDVFIGAGYRFGMNKNRTNLLAKFAIGAGGGGGVDTQGGFLIYPDIFLEQKIFENVYVSVDKGYILSPDRHFAAASFGFGVKYYIDKNGTKSVNHTFSHGKFKGIETILKHDVYFNVQRDQGFKKNMHQISLQINCFLNRYIYVAGQTSFANFGDAGAYGEGIIGVGAKSNRFFKNSIYVFTQILGGAAGGGGVSTGQGLIIKPSLGLDIKLGNYLSFRAAIGHAKSKAGGLNSSFVNFGINYNFSFLSMKK